MWMREAEVKHARLAMLAAAGWPLAELWHGPLCKITGSAYALDVTQGRSLSVLNGGLNEVNAESPAPHAYLAMPVHPRRGRREWLCCCHRWRPSCCW